MPALEPVVGKEGSSQRQSVTKNAITPEWTRQLLPADNQESTEPSPDFDRLRQRCADRQIVFSLNGPRSASVACDEGQGSELVIFPDRHR